jgi:aminoglycoside phosphotransferase (APT) family kinase protein
LPIWDAERTVDEALARELISSRFPQLDTSELRLLGQGFDNTVWVTRDRVAFRFPRRAIAIAGIEREIALLPILAPRLPVAIPDAAYPAERSDDFPWPWFGSRLIEGRELAASGLDDDTRTALAPRLAEFASTLHDLDVAQTASLPVDPFGRTEIESRVRKTRDALAALGPTWTPLPRAVEEILASAAQLPPPASTTLVHGDLHARHVLLSGADGRLAGVIDWGDVCRADPSADLSLVWSELPPRGRDAFFEVYGEVSADRLLRARVVALFLCAALAAYARDTGIAALQRAMLEGLDRTLRQ